MDRFLNIKRNREARHAQMDIVEVVDQDLTDPDVAENIDSLITGRVERKRKQTIMVFFMVAVTVGAVICATFAFSSKRNRAKPTDVTSTTDGDMFVLPPAPADLNEICSVQRIASKSGRGHCEKSCDIAQCCNVLAPDSCMNPTNVDACVTYEPCGVLAATKSRVPIAPENLTALCSVENLGTEDGKTFCEEQCEVASCCNIYAEDNCLDPVNMAACTSYKPCATLSVIDYFSGGFLKMAPDDLEVTCSVDSITTEDGRESCEDACRPSACCSLRAKNSCLNATNMLACASYVPCVALKGVDIVPDAGIVVPPAPEDLMQTCSLSNIMTKEGQDACKKECEVASCCSVHANTTCLSASNIDACMSYLPCVELNAMHSFTGGSVPMAPENLDITCSEESLSTGAGFQACKDECKVSECCSPHAEESCLEMSNMVACASYEPCVALSVADSFSDGPGGDLLDFFLEDTVPFAPPDLGEKCSHHGDADDCEEACRSGSCCFEDCFMENALACLSYMPWCANMFDFDVFDLGSNFQEDRWDNSLGIQEQGKVLGGDHCNIPKPEISLADACPITNILFGVDSTCFEACRPAMPCFRFSSGNVCTDRNCVLYTPWCAFINEYTWPRHNFPF